MKYVFILLKKFTGALLIYLLCFRNSRISLNLKSNKLENFNDVIFNTLIEGVIIIDLNGSVQDCNRAACDILGISKSELINNNLQQIFGIFQQENGVENFFSPHLIKKLFYEPTRSFVFKFNNSQKSTIWVSISTATHPVTIENCVQLLILTFLDVTNEIQNRKTIEEQKALLLNSERLSTLGNVAANIAHEIGNPLTVIRGNADILKRLFDSKNPVDQESAKKRAVVILKSIDHISKIISGVSRLSRFGDKDTYSYIYLPKLVEETMVFTAERFRKSDVRLQLSAVPEIEIKCREIQISQVILNLVANACDAAEETDGRWVKVDIQEDPKDFITILVTDSGKGISPEVMQKIFQPFFTTKQVGKGTGLGLPISKQIVEEHNGQLIIQTSHDGYTQFVVKLPKIQSVQN